MDEVPYAWSCNMFCHIMLLLQDADLVVLEFSANDQKDAPYSHQERKGYEQLIRKLLQMPGRWAAGLWTDWPFSVYGMHGTS